MNVITNTYTSTFTPLGIDVFELTKLSLLEYYIVVLPKIQRWCDALRSLPSEENIPSCVRGTIVHHITEWFPREDVTDMHRLLLHDLVTNSFAALEEAGHIDIITEVWANLMKTQSDRHIHICSLPTRISSFLCTVYY